MKEWARRFRGYLIVLPLALAIGFGYHVYRAWTGNDGVAHKPVDVQKGELRTLGPITVKLVSLSVKQPESKSSSLGSDTPQNAVVVVAKFRGRMDDPKKAKKLFCESKVENVDGWKWKSEYLSEPYFPKDSAKGCDGKRLGSDFKDIVPKKGQWYDFYYGYYVPKERAKELAPTLGRYQEYPDYLRFVS